MYSCSSGTSTANPPASSDLGIFANDPIPAPCPANTVLMNEIVLGNHGTNGSWIRRPWFQKDTLSGVNHVYRLTISDPDMSTSGAWSSVTFGDYGQSNSMSMGISPYPCAFPEEDKAAGACTPTGFGGIA